MKFLFWLWMSSAVALTATAQDYLDCHFVPGWEQTGAKRHYNAENLYDYKDGAAEGYLSFGFLQMQGIDCKAGAVILSIDVSEMRDPESAWGLFAASRDPEKPLLPDGTSAQLLPQSFLFSKGKYFFEIVETDGNSTTDQTPALRAFARRMEASFEGRSAPPDALAWFPPDTHASIRLVPQSVLGLRILQRGFVATYAQGQAFVVPETSPAAAAAVMTALREHFAGSSPASIADEAFAADAPYLNSVCIFRKGRYLAGFTNLPSPRAAQARAGELAARLP